MQLALGRASVCTTSARVEACASKCHLRGSMTREMRNSLLSSGSGGSARDSRRSRQLGAAVRADGEAIVEIVEGDGGPGPSTSSGSPAGAPAGVGDSSSAVPNGSGQTFRPQFHPPAAQQLAETPPSPQRGNIVGYKQAITGALAQAMQSQGGMSTAEIGLAKHKLLTGTNEAVRAAYGKMVRIDEVLLGSTEEADDRSGADASTSDDGSNPRAKDLATQIAVLLSEKAKIEVTGQLNRVRDKMTSRVSKANSYARTLEQGIRQRDKAIAESYLKLEALKLEVDNMQRMLEDGAREAPYIVDRALFGERFQILAGRAKGLRKVVDITTDAVDQQRIRRVRIEWTGYSEEVRLMGSFDNWTRGVPLSREDCDDSRGNLSLYSVELPLRPGVYEMKLLCDGQWFEIPDMPVDNSPRRNNIVEVK